MHRTDHSKQSESIDEDSRERLNQRVSPGDSPATLCQRSEETERLRELVDQLPERQRELLHLKIHGQLSYREMSEATGISVSNVGFLLHQAMRTLREKLASDEAFC